MNKRILAALLSAFLLAVMLAGCGDGKSANTPSITTVSPDTPVDDGAETTTELRPDLPQDVKFDGYEFKFLNGNQADWMVTYAISAEETEKRLTTPSTDATLQQPSSLAFRWLK